MATDDQRQIAELKTEVFRLRARLEFLYKHLALTFIPEQLPTDDPEVIRALQAGNILQAISAYRSKNKVDISRARDAVEEIRARLGI